jgi:hypothetical protein
MVLAHSAAPTFGFVDDYLHRAFIFVHMHVFFLLAGARCGMVCLVGRCMMGDVLNLDMS